MGGRLFLLSFGLLALLNVTGCGSTPDPIVEPEIRTTSLTVVVWSAHAQRAVPAEGTLTTRSDGSTRGFNTRATPAEGHTFTGLAPGAYRVQITRRFDPTSGKPQRVDGVEEVYLEPGRRAEVTVVVTDREGELGHAFPNSPAAPSSRLPRATARSGGPS